jgi:argininosuccinate lyase
MKKRKPNETKLWGGRFAGRSHPLLEAYTASIQFDRRLYAFDIRGSIAHARMLQKIGLLSTKEKDLLVRGLEEIKAEIEDGRFRFDPKLEDIHMHIEARLTEKVGEVGKKLHTARSRNDQVALDFRMYVKDEIEQVIVRLRAMQRALLDFAERNRDVIFPGYTHLQQAQPVLLAHHVLAYVSMFERDKERLTDAYRRTDVMPLGSGALAGTSVPIDREFVAKELGFSRISDNSIDAVSDRDFAVEYLSALAIIGVHLSRLSEELVIWSSSEFGFIEIGDAFCTGSSMMPQKKNPDVPELARGKTGKLVGNLVSLLTTMKGLPLSYNRDMQEDKLPVFESTDIVKATLDVFAEMMGTVRVRTDTVARAMKGGFLCAVDLAEYLVKKGVPFRESHRVVGKIVSYAIAKGKGLDELSIEELREFSPSFDEDALRLTDPQVSVGSKISFGGTSPKMVAARLRFCKSRLAREQ